MKWGVEIQSSSQPMLIADDTPRSGRGQTQKCFLIPEVCAIAGKWNHIFHTKGVWVDRGIFDNTVHVEYLYCKFAQEIPFLLAKSMMRCFSPNYSNLRGAVVEFAENQV